MNYIVYVYTCIYMQLNKVTNILEIVATKLKPKHINYQQQMALWCCGVFHMDPITLTTANHSLIMPKKMANRQTTKEIDTYQLGYSNKKDFFRI